MRKRLGRVVLAVIISVGIAACTGTATQTEKAEDFGSPSDPVAQACAASPLNLPDSPLLRLSGRQYLNTQRMIFAKPELELTPGFDLAPATTISELEVQ